MLTKPKPKKSTSKKLPPRGRRMGKEEARDYAFRTFGPALRMLAKN